VLEMACRYFCWHVTIAPESAGIVFGGGFPRPESLTGRRAAQRAIFHVQRELETIALASHQTAVVLCDRGTLDGLAHWPDTRQSFFEEFDIDDDEELSRYSAVVHVEVPASAWGHEKNPIRRESVKQTRRIDRQGRSTGASPLHGAGIHASCMSAPRPDFWTNSHTQSNFFAANFRHAVRPTCMPCPERPAEAVSPE